MEFGLWEKYYKEILDDFGFSRNDDEESAKLLDEILSTEGCLTLDDLSQIVGFSDKFIVFGAGPSLKEHIQLLKEDYDLTDYVNHSVSYFADKLDEYNNDDNYATVILELMQVQYNEYHGVNHNEVDGETEETYIVVDKEQYYPIYDYLAKMYYDKYITDDMTYDEMQKVADSLVEKVSLNTSEKYNIDYNRFYDDLSVYFNNLDNNINRTK